MLLSWFIVNIFAIARWVYLKNNIARMEIKIPFVSVCRVSSFSFAPTFTFWVLVWSIQTLKLVEFILICRSRVFRVFVLYHGMTALYFEKPIICSFILYLPPLKKEMYVMWRWALTCLSFFEPWLYQRLYYW